jgi:hypothetical protein
MKLKGTDSPTLKEGIALAVGAVAIVAAFVFVIVSFWPEDSATAKANYCNSLDTFAATVTNYQGLNPLTATNEERDNAIDDISSAWDDVVDNANDWANAYDNSLTNAFYDLDYAIDTLPSDQTLAEDLDSLEPELSAIPGAFHETFDGSGCTTATA